MAHSGRVSNSLVPRPLVEVLLLLLLLLLLPLLAAAPSVIPPFVTAGALELLLGVALLEEVDRVVLPELRLRHLCTSRD